MNQERPLWAHFFHENPYEGFPLENYQPDVQGWGFHPIIAEVIRKKRPKLIVEVGTWKGASAIHMALFLKHAQIDGHILCVDTFLGSPVHFLQKDLYGLMKVKHGRATLYEQFLANVLFEKCQDLITPLAQTADGASRILKQLGLRPEMVYIDGDHEYDSVAQDLKNYWELLKPGGVIVGDDYNPETWPGVVRAVSEFADRHRVRPFTGEGKYILDKPF